jgi:hypothetical protein
VLLNYNRKRFSANLFLARSHLWQKITLQARFIHACRVLNVATAFLKKSPAHQVLPCFEGD